MAGLLLAALLASVTQAPRAEFGESDYRSTAPPLASSQARSQAQAQIAAAKASEAQAAASQAEAEASSLAQRQALARLRPAGLRQLEEGCTRCHTLQVLQDVRRGWIGWRFTIERMRWWHGADIAGDTTTLLTQWLVQTQGAGPWQMLVEASAAALAVLLPIAGLVQWRCRRGRRRPAEPGSGKPIA